jgi:hypothetical protein
VAQVRYDRYSPYFMRPDEYGLQLQPFDFYPLIYPFGDEALGSLAYFFHDTRYDAPHLQALARWMQALWTAVERWRARWSAPERPRLALRRRDGVATVLDTRGEAPAEHELGAAGLAALEALADPRPVTDLAGVLGAGWEAELERLDALGLVWREGGRAMSLVLAADDGD